MKLQEELLYTSVGSIPGLHKLVVKQQKIVYDEQGNVGTETLSTYEVSKVVCDVRKDFLHITLMGEGKDEGMTIAVKRFEEKKPA